MVSWGKSAADRQVEREQREQNADEIWIKGFRDGQTLIRIVQPLDTWWHYREHYDEGVGYFTCAREVLGTCVGCEDPSEKVQQWSNRYAFNALDDRGRLNAYKASARLYESFRGKDQRARANGGTILERDWLIIRTGAKFNEIAYEAEAQDKHGIPLDQLTDRLIDLEALVAEKGYNASVAYGKAYDMDKPKVGFLVRTASGEWVNESEAPGGEGEPAAETELDRLNGQVAAAEQENSRGAADETPAPPSAGQPALAEPPAPEAAPAPQAAAAAPAGPDFASMTTTELKQWLREHDAIVADRAPRSRLVQQAEDIASKLEAIPY